MHFLSSCMHLFGCCSLYCLFFCLFCRSFFVVVCKNTKCLLTVLAWQRAMVTQYACMCAMYACASLYVEWGCVCPQAMSKSRVNQICFPVCGAIFIWVTHNSCRSATYLIFRERYTFFIDHIFPFELCFVPKRCVFVHISVLRHFPSFFDISVDFGFEQNFLI